MIVPSKSRSIVKSSLVPRLSVFFSISQIHSIIVYVIGRVHLKTKFYRCVFRGIGAGRIVGGQASKVGML